MKIIALFIKNETTTIYASTNISIDNTPMSIVPINIVVINIDTNNIEYKRTINVLKQQSE